MDRTSARAALIALLGVLAVAVAAATLPETVQPSAGGGGSGGGAAGGGAASPPSAVTPVAPVDGGSSSTVPPEVVAALLVLVALVFLAVLVRHRRALLPYLGLFAALCVVGAVLVSVLLFLTDPGAFPVGDVTGGTPPASGGGSGGETGSEPTGPVPPAALLALFVLAVVGTVAFARRRGGADADGESEDDEPESDDASAVGRAAGRAADRLESGAETTVENEVYRAWREMTGLLDLPRPDTTTPGEFASAAVDAGVDEGHVTELTRLFEDARYGGYDPTPDDERRAVAVLRRIEAAYAEAEP